MSALAEALVAAQRRALTKAEAHEIIGTLQAGTYDAAKWTVPF